MTTRFLACLLLLVASVSAQVRNPIMFVTAVPTTNIISQASPFGNQLADIKTVPRGGDLMIVFPGGYLKNLTREAGYGGGGMQGRKGLTSIAVREPSMHWSGKKAIFSMAVGAPLSTEDKTVYYWQLYEVSGLGKDDKPVITKVPNQPENFNNISPVYGTDDRIIFVSDRTPDGTKGTYPTLDEANADPTNTGLWSLNPSTGSLVQIEQSPSGDFNPSIDSYGRIIFSRWDHLTHDQDSLQDPSSSRFMYPFNYSSEDADAVPQYGLRTEVTPEGSPLNESLWKNSNSNPHPFTIFMPWTINQDGSGAQTINHIGRHDLLDTINAAFKDDPNLRNFSSRNTTRPNKNVVLNMFNIREDVTHPGTYYAVDGVVPGHGGGYGPQTTHSAGQIIRIEAPPTAAPENIKVSYVTDRVTRTFPTTQAEQLRHTGFYRNPLPTTDGKIVVSHAALPQQSNNSFNFRLKILDQAAVGAEYLNAGAELTQGISTNIQWWEGTEQRSYTGYLWELDPIEVVPRLRPTMNQAAVAPIEQTVFHEEAVDTDAFQRYLQKNNQALIVMRNITNRDAADKQQPYYLKVSGSNKQSPNADGKIYEVSHLQLLQGERLRSYKRVITYDPLPLEGRRILATPLRSVKYANDVTAPQGGSKIAADGSVAAIVPAGRAMTWQLTDEHATPVVRERYWLTFKAGEIRTCASCHGSNGDSPTSTVNEPNNKPLALRTLLRAWKAEYTPGTAYLSSPANNAADVHFPLNLSWKQADKAVEYEVTLSAEVNNETVVLLRKKVSGTSLKVEQSDLRQFSSSISWSVKPLGEWIAGSPSQTWSLSAVPQVFLQQPTNMAKGISYQPTVEWLALPQAQGYNVQVSLQADFKELLVDEHDVSATKLSLPELAYNTSYYWRVQARTESGYSDWSAAWTFTTHALSALAVTALQSPPNNIVGLSIPVQLSWKETPNATAYIVQVSEQNDFSKVQEFEVNSPVYVATNLKEGTTYFWRIQAKNAQQTSEWSSVWNFMTMRATSGVSDESSTAIRVMPQPASDNLTISFNLSTATLYTLSVVDAIGRELIHLQRSAEAGSVVFPLSTEELNSGSYTLLIRANGIDSRQRIVIAR